MSRQLFYNIDKLKSDLITYGIKERELPKDFNRLYDTQIEIIANLMKSNTPKEDILKYIDVFIYGNIELIKNNAGSIFYWYMEEKDLCDNSEELFDMLSPETLEMVAKDMLNSYNYFIVDDNIVICYDWYEGEHEEYLDYLLHEKHKKGG